MRIFFLCFLMFFFTACSEPRVKKYKGILDPQIGAATKLQINKLLGKPTFCKPEGKYDKCEYRTTRGRNEPTPSIHKKEEALGPDLSPYEHFDVLHLFYDGFGVLREWQPVVLVQ